MKVKSALHQLVTLAQALTIVAFGFSMTGPLGAATEKHQNLLMMSSRYGGGFGGAAAILLEALPEILIRMAIASAILWWLAQQKKLVAGIDPSRPLQFPKFSSRVRPTSRGPTDDVQPEDRPAS